MAPLLTLGKKISGKEFAFQSRQATEYILQIQQGDCGNLLHY